MNIFRPFTPFLILTAAFAAFGATVPALYLHHQRSTLADIEADLQNREIGLDPVNRSAVGKFTDGTKFHLISQEMPSVGLTGNLTVSGNTLLNGTLSASTGSFTGSITGTSSASGTGSAYVASSTNPTFTFIDTDGGTNEKNWDAQANAATLQFRTRTDGNGSGTSWLTVTRSGTTVSGVTFQAPLEGTGNVYASGSGVGYWMNTPGTFTYGMYKTGTSLAFRSGSASDFLTVNSSGQPTFANLLTASSSMTLAGNLTLSSADAFLTASTTDGADNHRTIISGGGGATTSNSRGASVIVQGNEAAIPGGIDLVLGNVAGSKLRVISGGSTVDSIGPAGNIYSADTMAAALGFRAGNTAASNTILYRSGADMWTTPDSVTISGRLAVGDSISTGGNEKFGYDEGSFTVTLTGCTTSPTGTATYIRMGKIVVMNLPAVTGLSNATASGFSGIPASLQPATAQQVSVQDIRDQANYYAGYISVSGGTFGFGIKTSLIAPVTYTLVSSGQTRGLGTTNTITYTLQ